MNEARKNAGDPGPVLARRLSNAEYNYTIRDLTGVDIRPTREFPVDPANTAGFDNSGESLTMSPALLNKYLQAAREVGDHMVLTPDGFDFAPHPMLVETDRDRYAIQRIVGFYERQPTDYADYFQAAWRFKYRSALGKPDATLAGIAAQAKVSAKYLPMVWGILEETPEAGAQEVGPIAKLQAMWRALPRPRGRQIDPAAARHLRRDARLRGPHPPAHRHAVCRPDRARIARRVAAPAELEAARSSTRTAAIPTPRHCATIPMLPRCCPNIPKYAGLHQEAAYRWAAVTAKARAGDPDLVVPAAERARYEASFARFASVFPDAFYVKERGRFFPDDSQDKGRLLSAGYHNVMGYWRDDTPLMELILDAQGQKELDRLWDRVRFHRRPHGAHLGPVLLQPERRGAGQRRRVRHACGRRIRPSAPKPSFSGCATPIFAKAKQASDNPIAMEAIRYHFQWVNDTLRRMERMHVEAEPRQLDALLQVRRARLPPAAVTQPERDEVLSLLSHAAREGRLDPRRGHSRFHRPRADVSEVRLPHRSAGSIRANAAPRPPVSRRSPPYALASRLSYFLWSSMPDDELLEHAAGRRFAEARSAGRAGPPHAER